MVKLGFVKFPVKVKLTDGSTQTIDAPAAVIETGGTQNAGPKTYYLPNATTQLWNINVGDIYCQEPLLNKWQLQSDGQTWLLVENPFTNPNNIVTPPSPKTGQEYNSIRVTPSDVQLKVGDKNSTYPPKLDYYYVRAEMYDTTGKDLGYPPEGQTTSDNTSVLVLGPWLAQGYIAIDTAKPMPKTKVTLTVMDTMGVEVLAVGTFTLEIKEN